MKPEQRVSFVDTQALFGAVLALLQKEGYKAVDMHVHTRFSLDGLTKIEDVVKKCRENNFGVAFTDHNHIAAYEHAVKMDKNLFLIPGVEVTCHNGVHILLYFRDYATLKQFDREVLAPSMIRHPWFIHLDHYQLVERAKKYECVISAAHPFGPGFIGIRKFPMKEGFVGRIDAIEAINSCLMHKMNNKAIAWADRIGKPITGGSDAHCIAEVGNCITLCKADSVSGFLDQVRKGRAIVWGKEESVSSDVIHAAEKFVREEHKGSLTEHIKRYEERVSLEAKYLAERIREGSFFHHFRFHHVHGKKEKILDKR
jgi:predicted metal-dependent phosphoesterase TrpH